MFADIARPLEVSALSHESPDSVTIPTNDVCAYISNLPYPLTQDESFDCASPSCQPYRERDQPISIENTSNITPASIVIGVPIEEEDSNDFKIAMGLIQCQTYLMRCALLQSIINSIERTPRVQRSEAEAEAIARFYYNKIHKFAVAAYQLAEARSSRGLLARSEYWCGRGCGGLRDWGAAVSHFAAAVRLDVSGVYLKNRPRQQSGLLISEREDVDILLQSVTQCYNEWIQKDEAHQAVADQEASPSPSEAIRKEALKGPRWRPHQDRMVYLAEQQCSTERRSDRQFSQLRSSEHACVSFNEKDMATAEERLSLKDDKQEIRKTLNADEWFYILHGRQLTKKRTDCTEPNSASDRGHQHNKSSRIPPSVASTQSVRHSSLGPSHDLSNALDTAGYESGGATPSLVGSGGSPSSEGERALPSPRAGYSQGRPNVKLPAISMSAIRKDARLDEAVLGYHSPTDVEVDDTQNGTGGITSGDSMGHMGGKGLVSESDSGGSGEGDNVTIAAGAHGS